MLMLENITLGVRKGKLDVTCAKILCYALYKAYTSFIVYGK